METTSPTTRRRALQYTAAALLPCAGTPARAHVAGAAECIVPAKANGGFDLTCKLAGELIARSGLPGRPLLVSYLPGGIGAVAYDRMVTRRLHNSQALVAFSSGSLLNLVQGKFGPHDVADVRWVAALGADYGAIAVQKDSPLKDLKDLDALLRRDFRRVVFGAGGTVGSQDWVKAALIARSAGQDHKAMRFVSFEGGGEALAALEGRHVNVFCGDAAEAFQALDAGAPIRILAVLSERRLEGARASLPTAVEQGLKLVWPVIRGFYVGRDVRDEDYRQWVEFFEAAMASPRYAALRSQYNLAPFAMTGRALTDYVGERAREYRRMAAELGLRTAAARNP